MKTLEDVMAETICNAFWETAEEPRRWETSGEMQRQVFRNCAVRAIAAARAFRDSVTRAATAREGPPDRTLGPGRDHK